MRSKPGQSYNVEIRPVFAENRAKGARIEGQVFTGLGRDVLHAISERTGIDGLMLLDSICNELLVNKGADWTSAILGEYLAAFDDSAGIFSLVWDNHSRRLVAHGSVFFSCAHPWAGLVAHIRTAGSFQGLGLGTLVTEQVVAAGFSRGVQLIALATDDKVHRLAQGERAAHAMYARIGFATLAEKQLADTIDRLMVIDEPIFREVQAAKQQHGGRLAPDQFDRFAPRQDQLVAATRVRFGEHTAAANVEPVSAGDLANLFVLMNLSPADDFRLKLSSWNIHHGPELERTFITTLRQAIVDKDRLHDASLVLRDSDGAIRAICAAQQRSPFTRHTYALDFYCLPQYCETAPGDILQLVQRTIERIESSATRPRPCRLSFVGVDSVKIAVFESLGFDRTGVAIAYYGPNGNTAFHADEYTRILA